MTKWIVHIAVLLTVGSRPGTLGAQPALQTRLDTATPGDTVVVYGGTHDGPLVIARTLVLLGVDRPLLHGHDSGHVVIIDAPDVTLDGFRIEGSGTDLNRDHAGILVRSDRATIRNNHLVDVLHGIYVKDADGSILVENMIEGPPTEQRHLTQEAAARRGCTVPPEGGPCDVPLGINRRGNGIHLWKSERNTITHNTIRRTRDGIYFSFVDHTRTAHNVIHEVRYGLHFMYSDDNTFEHNTFFDNASGSALMFSSRLTARHNTFRDNRTQRGYGLLLQTMETSRFETNRMLRNGTGVYLENSTGNTFLQNTIAANYRGLRMSGSSMDNRFGSNVIRGNLQTAAIAGVSATNTWQIDGTGNFWGPRGLIDLDGDGLSEWPHRTVDVVGARREAFPHVGLLTASPGLTLLGEALRRVPIPGVPAITDVRALMRPPSELEGRGATDAAPDLLWMFTLLAAGLLIWRVRG